MNVKTDRAKPCSSLSKALVVADVRCAGVLKQNDYGVFCDTDDSVTRYLPLERGMPVKESQVEAS